MQEMKRVKTPLVFVLAAVMALATSACGKMSDEEFAAAAEKFFNSDKGQETIGKTLEGYGQRKQQEMRKKQEEQATAEIERQFKSPVKIEAGDSPAKGPAGARVTVIEFSDFQCPYCKRGRSVMDELLKKYPNDVKVVFKQMPLGFHDKAMPAAKASMAAHKQGKFWEMHDALFDNQGKLGEQLFMDQAKALGLDLEKFKKDMESPDVKKAIEADMELAKKNGIQGTPGFFVNGVAVKGAYPLEHFSKIVDRWLAQ